MGDVLHALPAVTALRALLPSAWIGWAIEPQWEPLLRAESSEKPTARGLEMPVVDALHPVAAKDWARRPLAPATFREIRSVRRDLYAQRYDICIDLQGAIRSAWIGRMASASRMIGEAHPREPLARWLFSERVETTGMHVIEQAREVVSVAVKKDLPCCDAKLPIDADAERWCNAWLSEHKIEQFVLINPGAGWGAKRWPTDRYASLSQEFRRMGYATVVNVGPGESQFAETICKGNACAFAMSGRIGQLIACTRRASLFIGGDTGPLHLASALQIPVLGIYGPTDPARNGPYGTAACVLRHPASKRDHTRRNEPEAGLLTISVGDVAASAQELIREHSTARTVSGSEST